MQKHLKPASLLLALAIGPLPFTGAKCQTPAQTPSLPATSGSATPTVPAAPPSTTTPSDSNLIAHPAWYQLCTDRIAAAKGKPVDLLFIGDSITEGWTSAGWGGEERGLAVWNKYYAPRNALNFGIGADTTGNVLWRFEHMDVQDLKPKVAIVLIGTNNTHNTAPQIAAGVKAVLDKTQQLYTGTKIILVSIMPNRRATALMADANRIIRGYANGSTIYYLDLDPVMTPIGDNWKGLGKDRLHPDAAGYQLWAEALEPLLTRLLPPTSEAGHLK